MATHILISGERLEQSDLRRKAPNEANMTPEIHTENFVSPTNFNKSLNVS